MENRKKLHDFGLVLILLGVLNLFNFVSSVLADVVDGSLTEALAGVDPEIILPVKVMLGIIGALMLIIAVSDAFVGIIGLKISKNPTAAKGHIIASKIFFVFCVFSAISAISTLIGGNANIIPCILNLVNAVIDAVAYVFFIKAAYAVRRDVLGEAK